jgi:hypothetical protein
MYPCVLLDKKMKNHKTVCKIGLNEKILKKNYQEYEDNGLEIYDIRKMHKHLCVYIDKYIAFLEIPNDATVFENTKTSGKGSRYTNKFIVKEIVKISDFYLDDLFVKLNFDLKILEDICRDKGNMIQMIRNQTDYLCKLACMQNGYALKYVKNKTYELCKTACKNNGVAIQYVPKQTDELCKLACETDGYSICFIKNKTLELCELAFQTYIGAIKFIDNPREEIWKKACDYSDVFNMIKNKTPEICKYACEKDLSSFLYIENPSKELCEYVLSKDGMLLKHIRNQTKKNANNSN